MSDKRIKIRSEQTGPVSKEGKEIVSRNAISHGLNSTRVLLPGESKRKWTAHLTALHADLKPVGHLELMLTDEIALLLWRKLRLNQYEASSLRYYYQSRKLKSEMHSNPPSASDLKGCSAIPDGKPMEKIVRLEAHLRRELDRALERLAMLQARRGPKHLSPLVVVSLAEAQNCKTKSRKQIESHVLSSLAELPPKGEV